MWYSFNELRSHNCIMSFVLSNRGGGKTYGSKMIGIKDYLKDGQQFVYVRRLVTEFDTIHQFFDDIINNGEFPNHEFKTDNKKGYIRPIGPEGETGDDNPNEWEVMCYFIPLSVANKYKSTPYPKVTKIFFDEVIIDTTGNQQYLKNEPRILMELMSTIIRKRSGVKFFGMANNVSLVNPHFTFWNIKVNPNKRFTKSPDGQIVVELFKDTEFIKEMESTEFGKLISRTEYGKYAIHNESLCDSYAFICKRPSDMEYKCGFIVEGQELHCWYDENSNNYYVDRTGIGSSNTKLFSVTDQDHNPDVKAIKSVRKKPYIERLKIYYNNNAVYYCDITIQQHFNTLLKYI